MEECRKLYERAKEIEKERAEINIIKRKLIQKKVDLESKLGDGKEKAFYERGKEYVETMG